MLNYQSPPSQLITYKYFRKVLANGLCQISVGVLILFAMVALPSIRRVGEFYFIAAFAVGSMGFALLISGLVYVVSAVKVKAGGVKWIGGTIAMAWANMWVALFWFLFLTVVLPFIHDSKFILLIITVVYCAALVHLIVVSHQSRNELERSQVPPITRQ
jgi:hypothetical protein